MTRTKFMKTFFELREKTLTPAELKKREEIAKAIKRENPNMPMGKKMAIATAAAKKVAEEVALDEISKKTLGNYIKTAGPDRERRTKNATNLSSVGHDIRAHDPENAKKLFSKAGDELHKAANRKAGINKAVNKLVGESVDDLSTKGNRSLSQIANTPNHPLQSAAKNELARRKLKNEEVKLDEISAVKLGNYSVKAAQQGNDRLAGQKMADEKMRKKYGYSSSAKVAAGSLKKEEVELDEISQSAKDQYIKKSVSSFGHSNAVRKDAEARGDTNLAKLMRKRMNNRNKGMTRAFGGERD